MDNIIGTVLVRITLPGDQSNCHEIFLLRNKFRYVLYSVNKRNLQLVLLILTSGRLSFLDEQYNEQS